MPDAVETQPVVVHEDHRGRLVSVELARLPFTVRRSFVVRAPDGGALRGGHRAGCRQLMTLVSGQVALRLSDGGSVHREVDLVQPGDAALIEDWEFVDYELVTADTVVLVLAERPYDEASRGED